MKYKSVVATRRGGPEVLQIVESELRPPAARETRIKVLATPVVQDNVAMRVGNRPFLTKPPFVPGYSILGEVDGVGDGVTEVTPGDRVAVIDVLVACELVTHILASFRGVFSYPELR